MDGDCRLCLRLGQILSAPLAPGAVEDRALHRRHVRPRGLQYRGGVAIRHWPTGALHAGRIHLRPGLWARCVLHARHGLVGPAGYERRLEGEGAEEGEAAQSGQRARHRAWTPSPVAALEAWGQVALNVLRYTCFLYLFMLWVAVFAFLVACDGLV